MTVYGAELEEGCDGEVGEDVEEEVVGEGLGLRVEAAGWGAGWGAGWDWDVAGREAMFCCGGFF